MFFSQRHSRVVALAFAFLAAASATALAQSPMLGIQVGMNGGTVWGTQQPGTQTGEHTYNFSGSYNTNPNLGITWDVDADTDPFIIAGVAFHNTSLIKQDFSVTFALPTIALPAPTLTGGSASFSMTADIDGGFLTSVPNKPIFQTLIDNVPYVGLFTHPFDTGPLPPGQSPTFGPQEFGAPVFPPTLPGPAVAGSIGIRFEFSLTPGDVATLNGVFNVVPEPGTAGLVAMAGLVLFRRRRR